MKIKVKWVTISIAAMEAVPTAAVLEMFVQETAVVEVEEALPKAVVEVIDLAIYVYSNKLKLVRVYLYLRERVMTFQNLQNV